MPSDLQDRERDTAYKAPRAALSLADFELLGHLGDGSFSQVLHAIHRASGTECALKIIDKHLILRNRQWDQIRTERNVLDRLDHPGVIQLLFTFQDASSLYLGLELCSQGELFEQIEERKRLPLEDVCAYAAEIVLILGYLADQQVVHRDLKPENVLLDATGHVKLADFGSAKDLAEASSGSPDGMRANMLSGTAEYISPEVLRNEAVTPAADLWSLGCLIFQMLSGRAPFKGASEYLTLEMVSARDFAFPPDFPADARDLVDRLLTDEPSARLGAAAGGGMLALKRHAFFTGVDWERVREQPAPAWLPRKPPEADPGLNWELSSILAALPLRVETDEHTADHDSSKSRPPAALQEQGLPHSNACGL